MPDSPPPRPVLSQAYDWSAKVPDVVHEETLESRFNLDDQLAEYRTKPPKRWIVPGIVREGLTLFAGAPKAGKSFCSLDMAFGVAMGGLAFGSLICNQGDVLYLALEDSTSRLMERLLLLEPDVVAWPMDGALTLVAVDAIRVGETPRMFIDKFLSERPNPRLLIVDTLGRARIGHSDGNKTQYQADVEALATLQRLSMEVGIGVVVVHHSNQMKKEDVKEDWANKISGTSGLTGTADGLVLLDSVRGEREGNLLVGGRDLPDAQWALHRSGPWWNVVDKVPDDGPAVLRSLTGLPGATHEDLGFILDMSKATVLRYLTRYEVAGLATRDGYRWTALPPE
jgi:hypothetical protein